MNDDRAPVETISNHGLAYLVTADGCEPTEEADYLRRARRTLLLMATAGELRRSLTLVTRAMEELRVLASEGQVR